MSRRRFVPAALLMLALPWPTLAVDPWDTPDAKWRLGPVKWLLTKDEDQQYKKIKTDTERVAFVEHFWAQRDPDPSVEGNEYRDVFYQRSREAAARFTEDNGKGWQDDRGRVYILLGPPDDIIEGSSLLGAGAGSDNASGSDAAMGAGSAGGAVPSGYGSPSSGGPPPTATKTIRFVYRANPLTGKAERLELSFRSEVTGGYRLDEKVDWNQPVLRGLAPVKKTAATTAARPTPPAPPATSAAEPPQKPALSEPATEPPVPAVPEVTPQSELMHQVRNAAELGSTLPLDVTPNYYKAAQGTFLTLTLEIKRSALPAGADPAGLVMAAELVDAQTGESVQRFFKSDHFGGYEENAGAGAILLFQAERSVNPGQYKAIFAVKEPGSGAIGKLERDLTVPDFESGDLMLSTVALTHKLEPLVEPPPAGTVIPFVVGNFKVVPKPDEVFSPGEDVTYYYQVYNATTDQVTKTPKLELSYTFEVNYQGQWRMLGGRPVVLPGQTLPVQAYTLPLANRPPGEYRITIKVTDTLADPPRSVSAVVPFKLVGPAPAKAKSKSKG